MSRGGLPTQLLRKLIGTGHATLLSELSPFRSLELASGCLLFRAWEGRCDQIFTLGLAVLVSRQIFQASRLKKMKCRS